MRLSKQPWKKATLTRLIFSLICIMLPMYILSAIMNNWSIRTLQSEISKSMTSQVSQYLADLEKEFQRIQTLQYDCLNDENLNRLAGIPESLDDIDKMQNILRLQQRLNAIKNSSAYIQDVYAFIPGIDKNVSAITINSFDRQEYVALMNSPLSFESRVRVVKNKLFLSVAYPFSLSGKREPLFLIAVELSLDKLEDTLQSMKNSADEGLILTSPQFTLSTGGDAAFDSQLVELLGKPQGKAGAQTVDINRNSYLAVTTSSDFFGAVLSKYVPEDAVFQPLAQFRRWFFTLAGIALVVIIVYSLYAYKYIHKPLTKLAKAFRKIEYGDFSVIIGHKQNDEFQYIYTRFNGMVEKLNSLIDQVYKQQILTQRAELKQLQSQINPHFLYNSFFMLNTMTRVGDYEQLEQFTNQLGEYYQFITRSSSDEVPLVKEVGHAKVYTDIQAMRFSNRIKVRFGELPPQTEHIMVPRLILQPIIENAFEHGLEKKRSNGLLCVSFEKDGDRLLLIVEDNGGQMDDLQAAALNRELNSHDGTVETTALLNIHQRIRMKFGPRSGLHLEAGEQQGLRVIMTIYPKDGGS
ncbi:sensor histidine kinase [Paenibacillus sp. YN15]|uniref:sensor histidine kinase n=1 Tax=Paenibacillus sp. YN15 TaxID=1742774 RepID=UPI000DCBDF94|nr:histidine kinase [Paenibacillus sp. YN15]RAU97107.1 hypothetical protein DQG13_19235 [Paenibacillus sp. YN15]